MTLYYQFIFGYLLFQALFLIILTIPFPSRFRNALLRSVTLTRPAQWFFKAQTFIMFFIAIFFFESLRKMNEASKEHDSLATEAQIHSHKDEGLEDMKIHCRIFYAQRNLYLTGITLFTSFLLNRWLSQLKAFELLEHRFHKLGNEKKEK